MSNISPKTKRTTIQLAQIPPQNATLLDEVLGQIGQFRHT